MTNLRTVGKLLSFPTIPKLQVVCPMCKKHQQFRKTGDSWWPCAPFCCDAMRNLDTPEWNELLDTAIQEALEV